MILVRDLVVEAPERLALIVLSRQLELLAGQSAWRENDRVGRAFALVREEELHLVPDDWPADRPAHLLVLIRQNRVRERIRRVQAAVAEEAVEAAAADVRAR